MNIGALIIGDEILSGKRQDRHFAHIQSVLATRGLELSWTIIAGDDDVYLQRFLSMSMASEDLVFSFGGIGATPDDRTRQVAAMAANVPLIAHPDAVREIENQFGEQAYPNRILMGYLPEGSRIIPNPVNRVPGFSVAHHHFMPGFPEMAWPMLEWVLDNLYADLRNQAPEIEQIIYVFKGRESELLEVMTTIVNDYPALRLSSLPHLGETPHIELGLRGDRQQVETAMKMLTDAITSAGYEWSDQPAGSM